MVMAGELNQASRPSSKPSAMSFGSMSETSMQIDEFEWIRWH